MNSTSLSKTALMFAEMRATFTREWRAGRDVVRVASSMDFPLRVLTRLRP